MQTSCPRCSPTRPVGTNSDGPPSFQAAVNAKLDRNGLAMRELARRIGMDASGLSRKLQADADPPSFRMFCRIARELGLDSETIARIVLEGPI